MIHLVERGGIANFRLLLADQRYEHAQIIYGDELDQWMLEFDRLLRDDTGPPAK